MLNTESGSFHQETYLPQLGYTKCKNEIGPLEDKISNMVETISRFEAAVREALSGTLSQVSDCSICSFFHHDVASTWYLYNRAPPRLALT